MLVIDDDATVHDLLTRFLAKEGYQVISALNAEEGLRLAREQKPDVITLDVLMPGTDGWAALRALKADAELSDIPVIMLTIVDEKNLGFALGASEYLSKPVDSDQLISILEKYRSTDDSRAILVVDDDPSAREMLARMLVKEGWKVTEAENGRAALERVAEKLPQLILLDLMMPEMDGFEFLREMRKNKEWRTVPVIVVTAKDLTQEDRLQLNGYVEKILQKGAYGKDELLREVHEVIRLCLKHKKANQKEA